MFTMFNKEKNKTELSIRLTKDEKGKGNNPQDRYDLLSSTIIILTLSFSGYCTFYKDLPGPLYQNNFLFSLSMLLTRIPFRNYKALNKKDLLQQLLDIEVKEEQRFAQIHWKEEFYDTPCLECAVNDSGKVEKAGAVTVDIKRIVTKRDSPMLQTSTTLGGISLKPPVSR